MEHIQDSEEVKKLARAPTSILMKEAKPGVASGRRSPVHTKETTAVPKAATTASATAGVRKPTTIAPAAVKQQAKQPQVPKQPEAPKPTPAPKQAPKQTQPLKQAPKQPQVPKQPVRQIPAPTTTATRAPIFTPATQTQEPQRKSPLFTKNFKTTPASAQSSRPTSAQGSIQQELAAMAAKLAAAESAAQQAQAQVAGLKQQVADVERALTDERMQHTEQLAKLNQTVASLKVEVKARDSWVNQWSTVALKNMSHTDWGAAQEYQAGKPSPVGPVRAPISISL